MKRLSLIIFISFIECRSIVFAEKIVSKKEVFKKATILLQDADILRKTGRVLEAYTKLFDAKDKWRSLNEVYKTDIIGKRLSYIDEQLSNIGTNKIMEKKQEDIRIGQEQQEQQRRQWEIQQQQERLRRQEDHFRQQEQWRRQQEWQRQQDQWRRQQEWQRQQEQQRRQQEWNRQEQFRLQQEWQRKQELHGRSGSKF